MFFIKQLALLLTAIAVVFMPPATASSQLVSQKYALLIGVDNYRNTAQGIQQLHFAVSDVDSLATVLRENGFHVVCLRNDDAKREDIVTELNRHAFMLTEDDIFLLFFSGHGIRNQIFNNKTYWLTYDAQLHCLDADGIRFEHLLDYLRDIRAKRKLILLDNCFGGDLVRLVPSALSSEASNRAAGTGAPGGSRSAASDLAISRNVIPLAEIKSQIQSGAQGMVAIAASRAEAMESDIFKHGVFTYAILQAFKSRVADSNNDAQLSIDEFKAYLADSVPKFARQISPSLVQDITEATEGIDLTKWILVNNLPINVTEVEAKYNRYIEKLNRWYQRGWVEHASKLNCRSILVMWKESVASNTAMDEQSKRLFENIQADMENEERPEEFRAGDLNEACKAIQ